MTTLTVGSLCTGYGGLERALHLAYGDTLHDVWTAETDPDAALVLKTHHCEIPNLGDITEVDWRTVEPVDILCAGIPCQAVSTAGRRQADADPRWLWQTGARPAIDTLKPRMVVFENVRNLVGISGGTLWRGVLDDFRAMGYQVRWLILGACATEVAGCHHRHRVFAVAKRVPQPGPAVRVDAKTCGAPRSRPALPTPRAIDGSRGPSGPQRIRVQGNDLEPAVLHELLPTVTAADSRGSRNATCPRPDGTGYGTGWTLSDVVYGDLLPTPSASSYGTNQGGAAGRTGPVRPSLETLGAGDFERWGKFAWAVARWAAVFGAPPEPTMIGGKGARRLAPQFPEWMMGIPAGHVTDVVPRRAALRIIGNGVMPHQAAQALRLLTA